MPAKAQTTPETTYSQILMRLTRMPANCAASGCRPMATSARPSGVACRTTPVTTAMTRKIAAEYASCVPGIGTTPILVSDAGNPVIVRGAKRISARPRYRVSVPMVTAIEGSPTLAISTPLSAPPIAPTTSAAAIANQIGHDGPGQAKHRGYRQVDLAGHDDQGERQRHDGDLAHVEAGIEEVRRIQEVRGLCRSEDHDANEHDDQHGLPAHQPTPRGAPAVRRVVMAGGHRRPCRHVRGHGVLLQPIADFVPPAGTATCQTR